MKAYKNHSGASGISGYEYDSDVLKIQYSSGWIYEYHADVIGQERFDRLIDLAEYGEGLHSYLTRHREVGNRCSKKYKAQEE